MNPETIRKTVRDTYGTLARQQSDSCCGPSCCGPTMGSQEVTDTLGYNRADLEDLPEGAGMSLGCGNPQLLAALQPGETVVDLGSGDGLDVFLAAKQVGPAGLVIGVDMTPDMLELARKSAAEVGLANVEFRMGEIEALPLPDCSADVIMSNCVINMSADKEAVYSETFRVLKSGGRLAISDVVALGPLPEELQRDLAALAGCVAGAAQVSDIEGWLGKLGFTDIQVQLDPRSRAFIQEWMPGRGLEDLVASAAITARKP